MLKPKEFTEKERIITEKNFKSLFPKMILDYSPAYKHYYITNPDTNEKSGNISIYELNMKIAALMVNKKISNGGNL